MKEQQLRENVLKIYRALLTSLIEHGELLETSATVLTEKGCVEVDTRAHKEDHGKILGKGGRTFKALQTVLGLIGYRAKFPVRLNFLQSPIHGELSTFMPPMTPAENWKSDELQALLVRVLKFLLAFPYKLEAIENEIEKTTTFVLTIDDREQLPLASVELVKSLSTIFNAIGNAKGRHVTIATEAPKPGSKGIVASAGLRVGPNSER